MTKLKIKPVKIKDRLIIVRYGIAFYRSTGTNTSAQCKGMWFPFLGCTQVAESNFVHPTLYKSLLSNPQLCKPNAHNLLHKKKNSSLQVSCWITNIDKETLREEIKTRNIKNALIFNYSSEESKKPLSQRRLELFVVKEGTLQDDNVFLEDDIIEATRYDPKTRSTFGYSMYSACSFFQNKDQGSLIQISGKMCHNFEKHLSTKYIEKNIQEQTEKIKNLPIFSLFTPRELHNESLFSRIFHERTLAISASIGGSIWNTEPGIETKRILEEKFPEYFKDSITFDYPYNAKPETINMYIHSCGGYLNNTNFLSLFEQIDNSGQFPHEYSLFGSNLIILKETIEKCIKIIQNLSNNAKLPLEHQNAFYKFKNDLETAKDQYFTNPFTENAFENLKYRCQQTINEAETKFKEDKRIWSTLSPVFKGLLGALATIIIIPALIVTVKAKHGYLGTFFKTPKTDATLLWEKSNTKEKIESNLNSNPLRNNKQ